MRAAFLLLAAFIGSEPPHGGEKPQAIVRPGLPMVCGEDADIVNSIVHGKAQEQLLMRGRQAGDFPFEFYANLQTRTWTAVVHLNGGIACMTLLGEKLEAAPPPNREGT